MDVDYKNKIEESFSPVSIDYSIFESLHYPVSIIGIDGIPVYGNGAYHQFFGSDEKSVRLDWEHPFFPEYRKRVAKSYLAALKGNEKHCFAIINSPDGLRLPIEIYLFPMFSGGEVSSILALMIIVDDRLLSFDRSTLSVISEENFQYDNLHFEFSPFPIARIDEEHTIIKCSNSLEGFLGFSAEDILNNKAVHFDSIFVSDFEKIKKSLDAIFAGELAFKRIGEVKLKLYNDIRKTVNLIMYPIIQNNEISVVEIIIEDISHIRELKNQINTLSRIQLFTDITRGFLHTLNNSINVIMSKAQLLHQISDKEPVVDGLKIIEDSAQNMVEQINRIQNFIGNKENNQEDAEELLVNIINDAIEFSKMQFKVDYKDNRKKIIIENRYFAKAYVKANTGLLREIITSIILKAAKVINNDGTIFVTLNREKDLQLTVKIAKEEGDSYGPASPDLVNIFSGVDIRQIAEKMHLKILEEESTNSYAIKAIFPPRIVVEDRKSDTENYVHKLRDLDVMIVEDEKALQKILHELFDKMGNRVFICENGDEALEEFRKNHYDILVTDYGISGISGIELSARVKELKEDTVTILLSGWIIDDIKTYKNVVDQFIPKPFKLDVLLKKISKILAEKK